MLIDTCVLLMGNKLLENLVDAFILHTVMGNREGRRGTGTPVPLTRQRVMAVVLAEEER